jgi:hypothetical protein
MLYGQRANPLDKLVQKLIGVHEYGKVPTAIQRHKGLLRCLHGLFVLPASGDFGNDIGNLYRRANAIRVSVKLRLDLRSKRRRPVNYRVGLFIRVPEGLESSGFPVNMRTSLCRAFFVPVLANVMQSKPSGINAAAGSLGQHVTTCMRLSTRLPAC